MNYAADDIFHAMERHADPDKINVRTIKTPTLVIHGAADHGIPLAAGLNLAEKLHDVQLTVVDGACHAVNLTHPRQTGSGWQPFLGVNVYLSTSLTAAAARFADHGVLARSKNDAVFVF